MIPKNLPRVVFSEYPPHDGSQFTTYRLGPNWVNRTQFGAVDRVVILDGKGEPYALAVVDEIGYGMIARMGEGDEPLKILDEVREQYPDDTVNLGSYITFLTLRIVETF